MGFCANSKVTRVNVPAQDRTCALNVNDARAFTGGVAFEGFQIMCTRVNVVFSQFIFIFPGATSGLCQKDK